MSRKTGGNGHGPDEPDERGMEIIRRAADTPAIRRELARRRKVAADQARAERRAQAAQRKAEIKEARLKAKMERAERKRLAKAQKQQRQKYKDQG